MHVNRYHRMVDDFTDEFDHHKKEIRAIFEYEDYVAVFGWLQWVFRQPEVPDEFAKQIDYALRQGRAAYRVLDEKTIVPIGSEAEFETIKRAFADLAASEFHGARAHLKNATTELTAGKFPGSVRESIHAVESVAKVLEPSGDFSKAVAAVSSAYSISSSARAMSLIDASGDSDVRFTPESGHMRCNQGCPLWANSGHQSYSITSSARAISAGGTVRPTALAVLRLITSSNLVGCSTGRSAGVVPLTIWSTK
jgi:hypothetical protein